jgi:uncharacterized Zn-finger protein
MRFSGFLKYLFILMETLGNFNISRNPISIYNCEYCNYNTSHLGDWNKHLLTSKHQKRQFAAGHPHKCECGKYFTRKDSLYRHKKICNYEESSIHKIPEIPKSFQKFPNLENINKCDCGKAYKTRSGLWKHF